ncbi:MAG: hypothetical protein EBQ85_02455 [Proteobacteria bacterium]|nr:hypothetical protein [Pseudomonadota bacterium]
MSDNHRKFPEVRVYLLVRQASEEIAVWNQENHWTLPYWRLTGGQSWSQVLALGLKQLELSVCQTRLLGVFSGAQVEAGQVSAIFLGENEGDSLPKSLQWADPRNPSSPLDTLSIEIIEQYLAHPQKFWID